MILRLPLRKTVVLNCNTNCLFKQLTSKTLNSVILVLKYCATYSIMHSSSFLSICIPSLLPAVKTAVSSPKVMLSYQHKSHIFQGQEKKRMI